ncbi:MAG: hypothetical protein GXP23_12530 [Gammaproteobacteria bacterium]|nr:hypothetical protein [Gammaproteobacteria bacterium]
MNEENHQDEAVLGIVIVSLIGGDALRNCLLRIMETEAPCVVMLGTAEEDITGLRKAFPSVRFVTSAGEPVPVRRQHGVQMLDTSLVALIEDSSLPETGWEKAVVNSFVDEKTAAAGGPVQLTDTLAGSYLALGCGEYGRFHPRRFTLLATGSVLQDGLLPVIRLPGNNLAYRRDILLPLIKDEAQGLIEGEVNNRLLEKGWMIVMNPAMTVSYAHADMHGARLKTRFQHGRLFAGNRVEGSSWQVRVIWAMKSAVLPFLLTLRGMSSMRYAVKPSRWPVVASWIFMMESAWALGEAIGYLRGVGHSLEAWS